MSGQTLLNIAFFVSLVVWAVELVVLYQRAKAEGDDPLAIVSGSSIFFVLALPVANAAPDLVDRLAGFWASLIDSVAGLFGRLMSRGEVSTPRLMVAGKTVLLSQQQVRIGRYPNNDVVIDHPTVSAYHAEITLRPDGRHELTDRESRNGTRINGTPIRSAILRDGDQITLGAITLHYLIRSSSERSLQEGLPISRRRTG